jgi:hypothetical protein
MFVYCADTYCDACGLAIRSELIESGLGPDNPDDEYSYDSDEFPKGPVPNEESDSPDHCASREDCEGDFIDLREWGMPDDPSVLVGAESFVIGEDLSRGLTDEGVSYLKEMLSQSPKTPYQFALHAYWSAVFSDELS